jgi:dihydroorotase
MEHITTHQAVAFVRDELAHRPTVVATITAHHLLYNRTDIFKGGICPHMYCLPILKRETHRLALLDAATSGNPKFFIGTDSAPHATPTKESSCGCAGIFTAHAAVELYAEAFDSVGKVHLLEPFLSHFGQQFYGLGVSGRRVRLVRESWVVPDSYRFGGSSVRPLRAGETVGWRMEHL